MENSFKEQLQLQLKTDQTEQKSSRRNTLFETISSSQSMITLEWIYLALLVSSELDRISLWFQAYSKDNDKFYFKKRN